jgi:hypothetical protein
MKQITFFWITLTLLFSAQTTKAQFAAGNGTQSAPFQIANRADLEALKDFNGDAGRDKYFVLTADIDLAGKGWTAISTLYNRSEATPPDPNGITVLDTAFHGKLDGAGHKILNMNTLTSISSTSAAKMTSFYLIGLFGQLGDGAAISNLHITGAVTDTVYAGGLSYPRVGAIAGRIFLMDGATEGVSITNCSNDIRIHNRYENSNTGNTIGGLVGEINNASMDVDVVISKCSNTGDVIGGYHTGGLVGRIVGYAIIQDCYVNANIKANPSMNGGSYCGGIAGIAGTEGKITNCYAAGTITNNNTVATNTSSHISGGILGLPSADSPLLEVYNCVALQDFISYKKTASETGRTSFRIQGHDVRNVTRTNNYASAGLIMKDVETAVPVTGVTVAADGKDGADVALATAKTKAFYEGLNWDFTNTWEIVEGTSFPTLKSVPTGVKYPKTDVNSLKASAFNGVLTVKGLVPGEKLNVYTALGQAVSGKTATSPEATISLPASGIYLVSSGNQTVKVINK